MVPSKVAERLAVSAMSSEFPAAISMSSSLKQLVVPAPGEAHPLGIQARIVERVDDDNGERQVQKGVCGQRRRP